LYGLRGLIRAISGANHPRIIGAYKQWGARYRGFAQRRFARFSRGGGDWEQLKPSTLARRRKGKGKRVVAILRDTSTMFAALAPAFIGAAGALEQMLRDGIRVGFGGPGRHESGGTATIADIASFHQAGNTSGGLPKREIIVEPDTPTRKLMASDMRRALIAIHRENER
jgi:hypothetical protein